MSKFTYGKTKNFTLWGISSRAGHTVRTKVAEKKVSKSWDLSLDQAMDHFIGLGHVEVDHEYMITFSLIEI